MRLTEEGSWRNTWATTAFRSPPSAADTYDHPTSISWLYRAVGELHSAVGLSLLWTRRSGTHYRMSFVICLSALVFLGALIRRDISAFSAIEMRACYCAIQISYICLCLSVYIYLSYTFSTVRHLTSVYHIHFSTRSARARKHRKRFTGC